jgi:hypothetical protein
MKKRKIFAENYQPTWLPQMTADYGYILKGLDDNGIKYSFVTKSPSELKPLQNTVDTNTTDYFSDKINKGEEIPPAFISENDEILDGHNRIHSFKQNPKIDKIYCVKINNLPYMDSIRVLNKIQDRYNWEQEEEDNSVDNTLNVTNDINNDNNQPTNGMETINPDLNNGNNIVGEDSITPVDNSKKSMQLYRSQPLKPNSKSGNFFVMERKPRHDHEFQIEFDNLYEMTDSEITGNDPITSLAEIWFGNLKEVQEDAVKRTLNFDDYIIKKISEEAKKRGYDGIKYGTKFIQTVEQ